MLKKLLLAFVSLMISTVAIASLSKPPSMQVLQKTFGLRPVTLDTAARKTFIQRLQFMANPNSTYQNTENNLPTQVDLGMNKVPVLDQRPYATCVTFAVTSAIDAALGRGDYVSQQCFLELGNYLNKSDYYMNPWKGSYTSYILPLITEYGIVSKSHQLRGVCAGITQYPHNAVHWHNPATDAVLLPLAYHKLSQNVIHTNINGNTITDRTLIDMPHYYASSNSGIITISNDPYNNVSPNQALLLVKQALAQKNRVVIGYLITDGFIAGRYNSSLLNTWFLTPEMKYELQHPDKFMGMYHEILLYGYDDNAIATAQVNQNGKSETLQQQGLFYVRNSWGDKPWKSYASAKQYMTYDYLKAMITDATSIIVYKTPNA